MLGTFEKFASFEASLCALISGAVPVTGGVKAPGFEGTLNSSDNS